MVKRQFRMVTGLTGLLVATGVNGLLNEKGDGWVGSAYAHEADSGDDTADTADMDESSAEGTDDASEGEPVEQTASTEDDSGVEEESGSVEETEAAEDSESSASDEGAPAESTDEPAAQGPAEPDPAPPATAAQPEPQPQQAPPSQLVSKADRVLQVLYQHTREVLPDLANHDFKGSDSLKDLGANSVDRAEILMLTLETLGLKVPMVELAKAENLDALAALIASKMP